MEANVGDIITFTYYSNGGDINVDTGNIYNGIDYEAVVVLKSSNNYIYVCLPTRSCLSLIHKVEQCYIKKVISTYNKFLEEL